MWRYGPDCNIVMTSYQAGYPEKAGSVARYVFLIKRILILLVLVTIHSIAFSQQKTLISFAMEDQFQRMHTEKNFTNKSMIMLESDRGGNQFLSIWQNALLDSLTRNPAREHIRLLSVANLKAAPFFLKGFIRTIFQQRNRHWRLMDWKGTFADVYGFESNQCNIVIFNRKHIMVYQTVVQGLNIDEITKISSILRAS